jgi:NADH-quinone oxidoreductase subunit E
MIYLIAKMLALLMIAACIGVAIGWLLRGARDRQRYENQASEDVARIAALRQERDLAESRVEVESAGGDAAAQRLTELEGENATLRADLASSVVTVPSVSACTSEMEAPVALMSAPSETVAVNESETAKASDGDAPKALTRPDNGGDNLRQISGIGPEIEGLLHEMGIWRFQQIADFTATEVAWVDERLRFKGRIDREDWIEQAKVLAGGS